MPMKSWSLSSASAFIVVVLKVTSLLSYTRPERLSGDNKYFCDKCQEKQDALRSQTLRTLPPVLIFSLNR